MVQFQKKYKIKNFNKLDFIKKNSVKIDAAFICTPSSIHVRTVKWCIKNDINVFIEKPVATNIKDLNLIKKLFNSKKKINQCCWISIRFSPLIKFIKKYCFDKKKLGEIYNCEIFHGEHVDKFHSYDYKRFLYF